MEDNLSFASLLRSNLGDLTYNQLRSFLKTAEPESVSLDYKQEITSSLKKHFAAFSNKHGGIIIVGATEEKSTGVPLDDGGMEVNAKMVEQINQLAACVDPLPSYQVRKLEENGKGFICIRILKGGNAPYFVIGDSTVHIRTGNITKDYLEAAAPEELRNLFSRNENAKFARENNERFASTVANAHLESIRDVGVKELADMRLDRRFVFAETLVQPSDPNSDFISPYDLRDIIVGHRMSTTSGGYPNNSGVMYESIPQGMSGFNRETAANLQLHSNGLIYVLNNIERTDNGRYVHMYNICESLILNLRYARHLYALQGYSGPVNCVLRIYNISGMEIRRSAEWRSGLSKSVLLDRYHISHDLNTILLNNPEELRRFELEICKELHWHFGFESVGAWEQVYEKMLRGMD